MAASCGTGKGNFPQPGDPDLNSAALSAQSGFGGIAVSWTYPLINPEAVAHTLVFRSTSNDLVTAAVIRTIAGNYYFDENDVTIGTTYYYWIQIVSVNGTLGNIIGPASAVMQPNTEQIIALLDGELAESSLNSALRTKLDTITDVSSSLTDEEQTRLLAEAAFSLLLSGIATDLAATDTLLAAEVLQRTTDTGSLIASVDLKLAQFEDDNIAAILTEQAAFASAQAANAIAIQTLQATAGQDSATVQTLKQVVIDPGGLSAQFMVKTDVNGFVSGFGLYNDGGTSEFIVNVDKFTIGDPNKPNKSPFILGKVNGETQIVLNARTLIPDAHITNAMIEGVIQSTNYNGNGSGSAGSAGWFLNKNGTFHLNNIVARGDIEASSIKAGSVNVVDTLMLKGNAVTVPLTTTGSVKSGNGGFQTAATGTVVLNQSGTVLLWITINQGYQQGARNWGLKVTHNQTGAVLFNRSGMVAINDMPAWSGAKFVGAGVNTFTVSWYGADSTITGKATLTLLGAQR